jgi:hypothetical protein
MVPKMTAKKRTLGTPPADIRDNLKEPEIAPSGTITPHKIDKRTLRKAGRDFQLNAGVSLDFRNRFNEIAVRDRLQNWELIMVGTELYDRLTDEEKAMIIAEVRRNNPPTFRIPSR